MKLLPKLSLFTVLLVTLTAFITILFSVNTIKVILYDLNAQLVQKDLETVHQFIEEEYNALQKHGLQDVNGYYQKVIARIQKEFHAPDKHGDGCLVILDSRGEKIVHTDDHDLAIDWEIIHQKHIFLQQTPLAGESNNSVDIQSSREGELEFFYKKIPQWDLELFFVLEHDRLFSHLKQYVEKVLIGFIVVLFIALFSGFTFSRYLVRRIKEALLQIQAIKSGNMSARILNIRGKDEISELKIGLNSMTEIIYEKMLKQARAELKSVQSQKSLQKQHALLSSFINAMPELAFIMDEDGEYIEIFGSNQKLLTSQKELLIGKNIKDVLPEFEAAQIIKVIATTLATQETQTLEYELPIGESLKVFQGHASVLDYEDKSKTDKRMVVWIAHDITEQVAAKKQAHQLSLFDPLTELPNRRLLLERLDQEIARAKRHEQFGALLFIDLDNFKTINDSFGHRVGDTLLKQTAKRLNNLLRKEDLACRLGGDEFVVLLSNLENNIVTASGQAQTIAYKILELMQTPYELENQQQQISCSIGIVLFPEDDRDGHDLIKYADIAMYQAKDEGKNTVRIFAWHMQKLLEKRFQLQNDLRIALNEEQLTIHLQPQYNEFGAIISAEALVRWEHPETGFISPAEFIPIAEESGLVHALGKSVMEMVLQELQKILQQSLPDSFRRIAINVSPWEFGRSDYVDEVKSLLIKYQIPPQYLELEITEQTLVGNFSAFSEKMKEMQDMGIHFSIDDFGTGYSSLSYLKSLPVNMLKIDRTFIRDVTIDKNDDAIVKTIIDMARNLDLEVIAEGVETRQQLEFLNANGCYLFQGYYFSKPVPVDNFIRLLLEQE